MSRSLDDLTPDTRERVQELLESAKVAGLDVRPVSTLRTCREQYNLWAPGRVAPGKKIQAANRCRSWHVWGRAADLVIFDNGKPVWNGADPRYKLLGEMGRRVGLEWPLPKVDPVHFQFPGGHNIRDLCPDPERCEQYVSGKEQTAMPACPLSREIIWVLGREYLRLYDSDSVRHWDTWRNRDEGLVLPVEDPWGDQGAAWLEQELNDMAGSARAEPNMGLDFSNCRHDLLVLACWGHMYWQKSPKDRMSIVARMRAGHPAPPPAACPKVQSDVTYGHRPTKAPDWHLWVGVAGVVIGLSGLLWRRR